jgi:hypothetical protein
MDISTAIELVSQVVYKPGYTLSADDHSKRFEGTILLRIDYHAYASERSEAPEYKREIDTYATFPVMVADCDDITALYRRILDCLMTVELHEAREFLRVAPTNWAPFHPHKVDGMKRWAEYKDRVSAPVFDDFKFGLA